MSWFWRAALWIPVLILAACSVGTGATNLLGQALSPAITVAADPNSVPKTEIPIYGLWCGPKYPRPEDGDTALTRRPVDAVDAACMKHDLCYRAHGHRPACSCNRDLIWRTRYLQHHDPSLDGDARAMLAAIVAWFSSAPCLEASAVVGADEG